MRSTRELAAELNRLVLEAERRAGGRGTLKRTALARKIGVSASSLYAYLDGTTLPSTTTLDRLLGELDASPAERQQLATARDNLEIGRRVRAGLAGDPRGPVPHELPPDVSGFTGRDEQLAELDRLLLASDDGTAVVISAVSGTGGVGKTALALRWSHRARDQFPDGQLHADLRGYDPDQPVEPAQALATLLRSLGVADAEMPRELADRVARYRTLLDGRRMLVLLDNAFSAEQVRPLLPGSPSCRVLITSRDTLTGLVARDGAGRLTLDRLPPEEALALLRTLLGANRVEVESEAAADLVERCELLPLALRIAAEHAASRPALSLAKLAAELDQHRLDLLDTGDERTAIRSVFSWSYRQLPPQLAQAFRLIGLHPGQDFDAFALAALTDTDLATAHRVLDQLRDVHLVESNNAGRFRLHDLLREYAAELAGTDSQPVCRAAQTRLFALYAYTAAVAMDLIYPHEAAQRPRIPRPHTPAVSLGAESNAAVWLDAELANLLATADAAAIDRPTHILHLSSTLHRHLRTRALSTEAEALHGQALQTARRIGDRRGELNALNAIGHTNRSQGRHGPAVDNFEHATYIAREIGDRGGEHNALWGLGDVHRMRADYGLAVDCYQQALNIAREVGDRGGELNALWGLGETHRVLGRHELASDCYRRSLAVARGVDHRSGELTALTGLGEVHRAQGRYAQAIPFYSQALDVARDIGHRLGELRALVGLGDAYRMQDLNELAGDCYQQALNIARDIGNRNGQFEVLHSLGYAHLATRQPWQALTHHQQALDLARKLDQRDDQARALHGLARDCHALGHSEQARRHWRAVLSILGDLGVTSIEDVNADDIRVRLAELDELSG